jgi:hypothetical protein
LEAKHEKIIFPYTLVYPVGEVAVVGHGNLCGIKLRNLLIKSLELEVWSLALEGV